MVRVRSFLFTVVALLGVSLAPRSALAGTSLFVQFDPDVKGAALETSHAAWVQVDSYSTGAAVALRATAGGSVAPGRSTAPPSLTFVTSDAVAIPKLREAVAKGTHFKMAVLDVKKTGTGSSNQFLKITMADVIVSSAADKRGLPTKPDSMAFTLAFVKETIEYSTADGTGTRSAPQTPPANWDVKTAQVD
jgi:type VI protein secretion system component Hcp